HTLDSPPNELKYRCHWTPPLAVDPFDPNTVYYGCQVIFKTSNGGQSWTVLSPDLSTRDTSRIVSSGGIVGDNLGQFYGEVVFAIAPSESRKGLIWAGTNDGKLWNTRDGGVTWNDVTKNVGMPAWGTIRKIDPSRIDPAVAYVAVDYHMMDNRLPYLYKTADYGKTWTNVTGDLPTGHPLDYVMSVTENPNRKGMLFAGTGRGFYWSLDDGKHWTQMKDGLPAAPVSWIVVAKDWHDVVVSTYGRGVYVLRDVSMLEQSDRVVADASAHLFTPRPAIRSARGGSVDINYVLRTAPAPTDSVRIEVLDSSGAVIRTMKQRGRAGVNRSTWDLRYDGPRQVELRTTPPDNPRIWDEARFKGKKTRPINHWGIQGPERQGPLVLAGNYRVRVVSGKETLTQPLSVLRDQSEVVATADQQASLRAQLRVRDAMNETVDMINQLETLRRAVEDKARAGDAALAPALSDIDKKMLDVELRLVSKSDLHSDDKWYVESYKAYLNLIWLSGEIGSGAGDVAGGVDFRPTDASMATLASLEKEVAAAKDAYTRLIQVDLPAFNKAAGGAIALEVNDTKTRLTPLPQ
ncbi:MAG TPA: hypothetical protein VF483_04260, partial [Gemmatimonadaceae bacterium]